MAHLRKAAQVSLKIQAGEKAEPQAQEIQKKRKVAEAFMDEEGGDDGGVEKILAEREAKLKKTLERAKTRAALQKAREMAAKLNAEPGPTPMAAEAIPEPQPGPASSIAAAAVAAAQAKAQALMQTGRFGPPITAGAKPEPPAAPAAGFGPSLGVGATAAAAAGAGGSTIHAVRFDSLGRLIDEKGNLKAKDVDMSNVVTLKVNQKKIRAKKLKQFEKAQKAEGVEKKPQDLKYYDPRVGLGEKQQKRGTRRMFHFVREGTYKRKGEKARAQAVISELEQTEEAIKQAKQRLAGQADPNDPMSQLLAAAGRKTLRVKRTHRAVPTVEWWDLPFVPGDAGYEAVPMEGQGSVQDTAPATTTTTTATVTTTVDGQEARVKAKETAGTAQDWSAVQLGRITHYVEHPLPVEAPKSAQPPPPAPAAIILTKQERKKLRHRNRIERQRDLQDKVRLGLLPPPKPKTKMSNFMRVLGDDAVADPTAIEKVVREDVSERIASHLARNEARKLPPDQRAAKNLKKHTEDTSMQVNVAVFRVENLSHPQKKYKVDVNAQEHHLTGVGLLAPSFSVVIVEGGPKGIKKYKKLMLQRIDWATNPMPRKEEVDESWEETIENRCVLIWEGLVLKHAFRNFRMHKVTSEAMARQFLKERQVEHYWDLSKTYTEAE